MSIVPGNYAMTYSSNSTSYAMPASFTPKKETPMSEIKGGAALKNLHTRYALVKGGYVGQVAFGDQESKTEGLILWQGEVIPLEGDGYKAANDAKDAALESANQALVKALEKLFTNGVTGPPL